MKAVFLDRDGTVIEDPGYLAQPSGVAFLPGALEALRDLADAGLGLIFVTNQSGIGRGLMTAGQADAVNRRVLERLAGGSVSILDTYVCPHAPWDGCSCRKPSPELLFRAAAEHGVELVRSFMIGDKQTDVEAGQAAGCRTVLFGASDSAGIAADFASASWPAIAKWIVARNSA